MTGEKQGLYPLILREALNKAKTTNSDPKLKLELGLYFASMEDYSKAAEWLYSAAQDVEPKTALEALRQLQVLAENGHAESQFKLGLYHTNQGHRKNLPWEEQKYHHPLAEKWLLAAGEQNHAEALYQLAQFHDEQEGLYFRHMSRAAFLGHSNARKVLSEKYRTDPHHQNFAQSFRLAANETDDPLGILKGARLEIGPMETTIIFRDGTAVSMKVMSREELKRRQEPEEPKPA